MKKVGIVTFHNAHNYGAVLQCFALKAVISNFGYEACVIDHRNQNIENVYSISQSVSSDLSFIKRVRRWLSLTLSYLVRKRRIDKFNSFIKGYIAPEPQDNIYSSKYDAIVWGSDQIWRWDITGDDDFYWGKIGKCQIKKITYAASAGKINNHFNDKIKYLRTFDSIGVREEELKHYLELKGFLPTINLDPTLLMTREVWQKLLPLKRINGKPYILVYAMRSRETVLSYAKIIASRTGMQIKEIFNNCYSPKYIFRRKYACSPIEFLSAIYNAVYIVTDSFHGTVFSVIFNKRFTTVKLDDGLDNRSESLLSSIGISNRLTKNVDVFDIPINYSKVNDTLNRLRYSSINYLVKSINS